MLWTGGGDGGPSTAPAACAGYTEPVANYTRDGAHAYVLEDPLTEPNIKRAIWVGEVYENPSTDRYAGLMDGVVPFGDFFKSWVRGLKADAANKIVMDQSMGHLTSVTQWRVGPDGYAYALEHGGYWNRALLVWPDAPATTE